MSGTPSLLELCQRHLDPDARPVPITRQHRDAGHNTIARAMTLRGEVVIKRHQSLLRYQHEHRAYRSWAPALGELAPTLLAAVDTETVLILTALPGTSLHNLTRSASLSETELHDAHTRAGRVLARWHRAQPSGSDQPPREAGFDMPGWLASRGARWLRLAEDILPRRRRDTIAAHLRALADLGPLPVAPCHLDFTPRNLLRSPDGQVAVIDFEHARRDLPARDLVHHPDRVWVHHPDLREAFLHGYGPLTDADEQVIDHCRHLDTLTTAVRAAGRNLPPAPLDITTRATNDTDIDCGTGMGLGVGVTSQPTPPPR